MLLDAGLVNKIKLALIAEEFKYHRNIMTVKFLTKLQLRSLPIFPYAVNLPQI